MMTPLTIAVAKGRLQEDAKSLLMRLGLTPQPAYQRKLLFDLPEKGLRFLYAKNADVVTLVRNGVAHLGMVGKDTLLEQGADVVYELADLKVSACRLVLAAPQGVRLEELLKRSVQQGGVLKVATKYPNIAKKFFSARNARVQLIHLYGSVELAPAIELADCIVDLVDTGATLHAHQLWEQALILNSTARLICSESSFKAHRARVLSLRDQLSAS